MKKRALVTGGTSGIGYQIAAKLIKSGFDVGIIGSDSAKVEQARNALGVSVFTMDLRFCPDASELVAAYKDGLDLLVNNAGIARFAPIDVLDNQTLDEHLNVNLKAPLYLIQALIPALEKRKGCVINMSSAITRRSSAGFAAYAASKAALEAITKALAAELAGRGIRVNGIRPGAVATEIFFKMGIPSEHMEAAQAQLLSTIPLGRLAGPEEIAEVVLAQANSSYVTGAVWAVDGGVDT